MGVVYEALDQERGEPVALKVLRNVDPIRLARFKREFRALADVEHPNLVRLGELHEEAGTWFFTMELVPGVDFLEWVRYRDVRALGEADTEDAPAHSGRYDEIRLRDAFTQLARGLHAMHGGGRVHRDIKPSNVRVSPDGRVVVLDFGLVTAPTTEERLTEDGFVGTPAYAAPEQGASAPVGPPADWYSFGVMLYELLTGQLPFSGARLDVLVRKQQYEPAPPRAIAPDVPHDLDALCVDLLRREPSARPPGDLVLERLGARARPSLAQLTPPSSLNTQAQVFVGRERELAALRQAFDDSRHAARMVIVEGESGLGKTSLVQRFCDEAAARDCSLLALWGRCHEREQVPYKAFDGIVDALARHLSDEDPVKVALILGDDAGLVARLFPVLRRVPAMAHVAEPQVPNPQELRTRAFLALRSLLQRLARRRPVVLVIDDLQWVDLDSLLLLAEVLRRPDEMSLVVIATRRPGEVATSQHAAYLERLEASVALVPLTAMAPEEGEALARALLGHADPNVDAAALAREADGHPLFLRELVQRAERGETALGTTRLEDALWSRIVRLDPAARRLLQVVCIAGAPLPHATAAMAAGMRGPDALRWAALLRAAHLCRKGGQRSTDAIEPYHDRVRTAVSEHMDAETRRSHHEALANALESTGSAAADPQVLVRHLLAAGHKERAAAQAVKAAERATEAVAFDQGAELYRIALALGVYRNAEERQLRLRLGEVLVLAGRGKEAAEVYIDAARGADEATVVECRRIASEQLLIGGHVEQGLAEIDALLRSFGERLPSSRRALVSVAWNRFVLRVRGLRWKRRDATRIVPADVLRADLHFSLALGLTAVDTIVGVSFITRAFREYLRIGDPARIARVLGHFSTSLVVGGPKEGARASKLRDEAARLHGSLSEDDPDLEAWLTAASGVGHYLTGQFRKALEMFVATEQKVHDLPRPSPHVWNQMAVFPVFTLRQLGDVSGMQAFLSDRLGSAARRGDRFVETTLLRSGALAWLAADDPEQARQRLRTARWVPPEGRFHLQHYHELHAESAIALYEGRAASTWARISPLLSQLRRSQLSRAHIVHCEAMWISAKMALAGGLENRDALNHAERLGKLLAREPTPYSQAWSGLVRGAIEVRRGRTERAVSALRESIVAASASEMALCAAAARYRLGEILGGSEGAALLSEARQWMASQSIRNPEALLQVIAPGFSR